MLLGLVNDHIAVMKRIEKTLPDALADVSRQQAESTSPFALVTRVAPGSLSSAAGFCPGDQILRFGSLTRSQVNEAGALKLLSAELEGNSEVPVAILRRGFTANLFVKLDAAKANSTLGCHLKFIP